MSIHCHFRKKHKVFEKHSSYFSYYHKITYRSPQKLAKNRDFNIDLATVAHESKQTPHCQVVAKSCLSCLFSIIINTSSLFFEANSKVHCETRFSLEISPSLDFVRKFLNFKLTFINSIYLEG